MKVFTRSAALVAAVLIVGYGLLVTRSQASAPWLALLGIAFLLLLIAFWPRLPRALTPTERSIVRVSVIFMVAFLMISVQLVRIQVVDSAAISSRTGEATGDRIIQDPRQRIAAADIVRGKILTHDGGIVAETTKQADGTYLRSYPDPTTGYLAGYFSPLLYGSSNLEQVYDDYLMGRSGGNPVTQWLDGVLHRTKRGYDLTLSIDDDLQKKADQLLGNQRGAVILMDAKTGAVLSMVSKPNYDPNKLYVNAGPDLDKQIADATAYWNALNQESGSPLVLRDTQGLYVPGSVFKTVTASAAIETGTAKPDTVYRDEGALTVGSRVIPEENRPDPNRVDYSMTDAYGYSLNVVFAQIGLQVGPTQLENYAHKFGLGDSIPFDLPVTPSRIASDPNYLNDQAALAVTAFGQGQLQVTPLQMAMIADAVANQGNMMHPYLLDRVIDADGKTLQTTSPTVWKRAITSETAAAMRDIMVHSVKSGYASEAQIPGYVVGGKTGTAEVGDAQPHAWFIGFAGKSDPQYVVAVVVENGGSGGKVALPIGREMLKAALERKAP